MRVCLDRLQGARDTLCPTNPWPILCPVVGAAGTCGDNGWNKPYKNNVSTKPDCQQFASPCPAIDTDWYEDGVNRVGYQPIHEGMCSGDWTLGMISDKVWVGLMGMIEWGGHTEVATPSLRRRAQQLCLRFEPVCGPDVRGDYSISFCPSSFVLFLSVLPSLSRARAHTHARALPLYLYLCLSFRSWCRRRSRPAAT